ncbi:hypothetical protein F4804DRAFT_211242 [Jackrogersella minutella]|nr:hypothetical protein F4804DRAFT_211242 [Jackrogersella minutella]
MGGFAAQSDDGQEFLQPDNKDLEPIVPIDYNVTDSYPDFSFLSESAEARCKFCSFLRVTITGQHNAAISFRAELDKRGMDRVEIHLEYAWGGIYRPTCPTLLSISLQFLNIYLRGSYDRGKRYMNDQLSKLAGQYRCLGI